MSKLLHFTVATFLLGGCASIPVDESVAPFAEGVYYFSTSNEPANRSTRRVSGSLVLAEDGSVSVMRPTYRCTQPSPRSWLEEEAREITFTCGDLRFALNPSDGWAAYTIEHKSTIDGECIRYTVDFRGRRTKLCEQYRTRTVTERETIVIKLAVVRVNAE